MALVEEAGLHRDDGAGHALGQQFLGVLDAAMADEAVRGEADLLAEDRDEAPDAQARDLGELLQKEVSGEIALDMLQGEANAGGTHWRGKFGGKDGTVHCHGPACLELDRSRDQFLDRPRLWAPRRHVGRFWGARQRHRSF